MIRRKELHAAQTERGPASQVCERQNRVTNWPAYDAALVRRGDLTIWLSEEAIAGWSAPVSGKRGGQPVYSDLAIEAAL
jgi:hypothetical protein